MTDYAVTNGRSASYPAKHYGALYPGGSVMTFCEDKDLLNPSASVLSIPTLPFSVITTSPFSVSNKFFGMHVKYRANDQLIGLTVGTVRSHDMENGKARWQFIQPTSSTWDWTDLDSWVNTHYAAGRDILFTLFGTPQWASARPTERNAYSDQDPEPYPYNRGITAEPSDMTKWDAYCTAVATRYLGKIKYYEVWNEPNYQNDGTGATGTYNFFSGTYAKLAEMVRRANQAIKAVDPTAKIVSPPITNWVGTAGGTAETYFTGMLAASDGATGAMKDWIDIVGVHLYIGGNDITKLPLMIDRVKAGMATASVSGKEIWDTESAPISPDISGMSLDAAKLFIVRSMLIQAAKGIARTFYFQYDDPTMGFNRIPEISALREQIITMLRSTINTVSGFTDGRVAVYTDSLSMI